MTDGFCSDNPEYQNALEKESIFWDSLGYVLSIKL
jgi:hypothetical protein